MEWSFFKYLTFLAEDGWPSLVVLATTTAVLMLAALPKRKLVAGAPGMIAIAAFVLSCYLASLAATDTSSDFANVPAVGLLLTVLLVIPSVFVLRNKWLGLLHILTLPAALFLSFICILAISGDAT